MLVSDWNISALRLEAEDELKLHLIRDLSGEMLTKK